MEKNWFKTTMLIALSAMTIISVWLLYQRQTIFFGNYAYGSGAIIYNFYLVIFFLAAVFGLSANRTWGWTFTQAHLALLFFSLAVSAFALNQIFIYMTAGFILALMIAMFVNKKEFYVERH